jgi:membrane associated rhomboid family serine protease
MLESIVSSFAQIGASIQENLLLLALILLGLWAIQIVNSLAGYRLNLLGIYPRSWFGVPGILLSSFLHGSYKHLFFNSIPLFVLAALVLVQGKLQFVQITLIIILISGIAVWLFGRRAFHVGASSLIMGYWGFLLFNAYQERSTLPILLALLCLYYFSNLALSLFPTEQKVSWEGHVFGFLGGIIASYMLSYHYLS